MFSVKSRPSKRRRATSQRNVRKIAAFEMLEPRLMLTQSHSGIIATNETWTAADVHRVTGDVTVESGATLTIEAGTLIQFDSSGWDLFVKGELLAAGSASHPIVFTSIADDTGLDGQLGTADDKDTGGNGPTQGSRGQWGSIQFASGSTGSLLDHVQVRYGGAGATSVVVADGELTLRNSLIRDSSSQGLRIVSSNPTLVGNTLRDNGQAAMSMDLVSDPAIADVTLQNNGWNALRVDSGIIAADTKWDDADVPYVLAGDVAVEQGAKLTISSGQAVAASYAALIVRGTLDARGTTTAPVIFTSTHDNTLDFDVDNRGAEPTPMHGNWTGIRLDSRSTDNVLEHVEVRYAGTSAPKQAAVVAAGPLLLRDSVIMNSYEGLRIEVTNPVVSGVTFRNNIRTAASMDLASNPDIDNVALENNGINGLQLDGGNMTQNGTWDDADIPYVLSKNLTVDPGQILTVGPGQVVAAAGGVTLTVGGTVLAQGTALAPVIFTSDRDNSFRWDINGSSPYAPSWGNWPGIRFQSTSVGSTLDHIEIRYAGTSVKAQAALVTAASLTLRDSVIRDSYEGLRITGAKPVVSGVTIYHNARAAISMDLASDPAIREVSVSNNGINGLEVDGGTLAQSNRWDDPDIVYVLGNDITVATGTTLTIAPGQTVAALSDAILVDGTLSAQGTTEQPILFTSTYDTPGGIDLDNRPDLVPARGNWPGIRLQAASENNVLDHVEIRYAGTHTPIPALVLGGPATVTNTTIHNSIGGVRIEKSDPVIAHVVLRDNPGPAMSMDLVSAPKISDIVLSNNNQNAVVLDGGALPGDTTWNNPEIVYWINKDLTIPTDMTLNIVPGQAVALKFSVDVFVQGTLTALGTAEHPIIFTSTADESLGVNTDNATYKPNHGDWGQLQFTSTSVSSVLQYCDVRYGGGAAGGTVFANGGPLQVRNSIVRDNWDAGLTASNGSQVELSNSLIIRTGHANDSDWQSNVVVSGAARLQAFNNIFDSGEVGIVVESATVVLTNNLITNNTWYGVYARLNPTITASYNDVYNKSHPNYQGTPDLTGTAGNISADPLYFSQATGQYQLSARSPAIDAGTSDGAPLADRDGRTRFDDPHVPNRGAGAQPFVDLGPYERQEASGDSDIDLAVVDASGPAKGLQDQSVTVHWGVRNVGTGVASRGWHDAVYLSADPTWTPDDLFLGETLHDSDLGPGQTYEATANFVLPGVLPGDYYFLVRANWQNEAYEGNSLLNNRGVSANTIAMDLPSLAPGAPLSGTLSRTGQSKYYRMETTGGESLAVQVTGPATVTHELYLTYSDLPSRQLFDERGNQKGNAAQSVSVDSTRAGAYFVMVYGANVPTSETFTITAAVRVFGIDRVEPEKGSNSGQVTITVSGAQFPVDATVALVKPDGGTLNPTAHYVAELGRISATFDLRGQDTGLCDVAVTRPDGVKATLPDAFEVVEGTTGKLDMNLVVPERVRIGRSYDGFVEYVNAGQTDLLAPVITLTTTGGHMLSIDGDTGDDTLSLIAVNPRNPAGILPPGAGGRISFHGVAATIGGGEFLVSIGQFPNTPIPWDELKSSLKPAGMSDEEFEPLFVQLQKQIGDDWPDYQRALSADATLLPSTLGDSGLLSDVYQLELLKAQSALHTSVSGRLMSTSDGLPLADQVLWLCDSASGMAYDAATLNDGRFVFPDVAPGRYTLGVGGAVLSAATIANVETVDLDLGTLTASNGGSVSGYVYTDSGSPVWNATISGVLSGGDTLAVSGTDARGTYQLRGLPAGSYSVQTTSDDFSSATVDVTLAGQDAVHNVNLVVNRAGVIGGKVVNTAGQPIHGALVVAECNGKSLAAFSEPDGTFTIASLPPGEYNLRATSQDRSLFGTAEQDVAAGQKIDSLRITASAAGGLRGQLTSAVGGAPIKFGFVTVLEDEKPIGMAQADSAGQYELLGLPPGVYQLRVSAYGYQPTLEPITIQGGVVLARPLSLQPFASVRGVVSNASGTPLPGVSVRATQTDGDHDELALTDGEGRYEFANLPLGAYVIQLPTRVSGAIQSEQFTLNATGLSATRDFQVNQAGTAGGLVTDSDGAPVTNAQVLLIHDGQKIQWTGTDSSGRYTFYVLHAGTYDLAAVEGSRSFAVLTNVEVSGGRTIDDLDFQEATQLLRGTVKRDTNGTVVGGARVVIMHRELESSGAVSETETNADGSFEVTLAPGQYRVFIAADGLAVLSQSLDVGSEPAPIEFRLKSPVTLGGNLMNAANGSPIADGQILVYRHDDGQGVGSAFASSAGAFTLSQLAPDTYDIVVSAPGFQRLVLAAVAVMGDKTLDLSLSTPTATVRGHLAFPDISFEGSYVHAVEASGRTAQVVAADSAGNFTFDELAPGSYLLVVSADGFTSDAVEVVVTSGQSSDGVVLTLVPAALSADLEMSQAIDLIHDPATEGGSSEGESPSRYGSEAENDAEEGWLTVEQRVIQESLDELPSAKPGCETLLIEATHYARAFARTKSAAIGARSAVDEGYWSDVGMIGIQAANALAKVAAVPLQINAAYKAIAESNAALDALKNLSEAAKVFGSIEMATLYVIASAEQLVYSMMPIVESIHAGKDVEWKDISALTSATVDLGANLLTLGAATKDLVEFASLFKPLLALATPFLGVVDAAFAVYEACVQIPKSLRSITGRQQASDNADFATAVAKHKYFQAWSRLMACNALHDDEGPGVLRPEDALRMKRPITSHGAVDPNDKTGPSGAGDSRFVLPGTMAYTIQFENDPNLGATVAAQEVKVSDILDPDLDLTTLEFAGFGFNNLDFEVPPGLSQYETTIDLRPHGIELLVDVTFGVNPQTRELTAQFRSLDPLTAKLPDDIDAGFLPVNDKQLHNGEGYFSYRIQPKPASSSGTEITNQASIVFDINSPILTPRTLNTLDTTVPMSHVETLPQESDRDFTVSWSGSDEVGGSGIRSYEVFVAIDGNPYEVWLRDASATTAVFHGLPGKTYAFFSVATDYVGHVESAPTTPDAQTTVVAVSWQNTSQPFDVNRDGFIAPMDVLAIINELNIPMYHDSSGRLQTPPPIVIPACYDVTGDGFVAPLDALQIINYLNAHGPGPAFGEGEASGECALKSQFEAVSERAIAGSAGSAAFATPVSRSQRCEGASTAGPSRTNRDGRAADTAAWQASDERLAAVSSRATGAPESHDEPSLLERIEESLGEIAEDVATALMRDGVTRTVNGKS